MGLGSFIRQALGGKRALSDVEIRELAECYAAMVAGSITDGGEMVYTKNQIHFFLYNENTGILLYDEKAFFEDMLLRGFYIVRAAILLHTGTMDIIKTSDCSEVREKVTLFWTEFSKGVQTEINEWKGPGEEGWDEYSLPEFLDALSGTVEKIPKKSIEGHKVLKFSEENPIDIEFVNQAIDDLFAASMLLAMNENEYFENWVKAGNIQHLKRRLGVDLSRLALFANNALRQIRS